MIAYIVSHATALKESSTVASVAIANFLIEQLTTRGFPVTVWEGHDPAPAAAPDDAELLYVNSPPNFAGAPWHEAVAEQVCRKGYVTIMNNDYHSNSRGVTSAINKRWKSMGQASMGFQRRYWSTVTKYAEQPHSAYINWNALAYLPGEVAPVPSFANREPGLFYFGAYREDRVGRFAKFFDQTRYPVRWSISATGAARMAKDNASLHARITVEAPQPGRGALLRRLATQQATLYVEDVWSSLHYCSPANRFYEALAAGTAIFVDRKAVNTLTQAGYPDVEKYAVWGPEELADMLPNAETIAEEQQVLWAPLAEAEHPRYRLGRLLR